MREISVAPYKIRELVARADDGALIIPPFQRDVVWEQDRMISLWDSMYRCFPIGTLLYWTTEVALDTTRAVGGAPLNVIQHQQRHDTFDYVLDGQQRLTAIYAGMKGGRNRIEGKAGVDYTLYFDATAGVVGPAANTPADDDILDVERDTFTGVGSKPGKSPFFIFEAEAQRRRVKLAAAGLPAELIVRVSDPDAASSQRVAALKASGKVTDVAINRLARLAHMFDTYTIPVTHVSGITLADVCGVYLRINRMGRRIDPADVVIAAVFGAGSAAPTGFNLRARFNDMRDALGQISPRWRQLESLRIFQMVGMCVREARYRANKKDYASYSVDTERLLNLRPNILQPLWDDIADAITRTLRFVISEGVYDPDRVPGAYLLMPLCAYLFQRPTLTAAEETLIRQWFWRTAFDSDALDNSSDILTARTRFFAPLAAGQTPTLAPLTLTKRSLISNQDIDSSFSRAFVAFLSSRRPRDFKTGDFVTSNPDDPRATAFDEPTIHHICPKKLLRDMRHEARAHGKLAYDAYSDNALLNLCLLPGPTNSKIGHRSPAVYFPWYADRADFNEIMDSHLISGDFATSPTFTLADYPAFIEQRLRMFQTALDERLPNLVRWE